MQFEFSWRDASTLERELSALCGRPVLVSVTDNTSTMITVKHNARNGAATLRVHRMFLHAGPDVVRALALWVKRHRCQRSSRTIDDYIRAHRHLIAKPSPRRIARSAQGAHHDLQAYYDSLNESEFGNSVDAPITWDRRPTRRRRRSIRFGSYSISDHLIRIHPYLDAEFVPQYFVRYIVFHEMLHAHLGIEEPETGRRKIHTPAFNARERTYPDYERAVAWHNDSANLRRLLR